MDETLPDRLTHTGVIMVTATLCGIWNTRCIMSVGEQSLILQVSDAIKCCLAEIGKRKRLSTADTAGVFLVIDGAVCMRVKT
jgi:hypothetical protein